MESYAWRLLARYPGGSASAQDAADVVKDFLSACLDKGWLARADREHGKFRAFIQVLLKRHVTGWVRHKLAQKRRPAEGRRVVPLLPEAEGADIPSPADEAGAAFDRSWTEVAVERALERLREENERYHAVIADLIRTHGEGSADMADQVGLHAKQFPVLKHRARRRFSSLFKQELRATVDSAEAFEEEWRTLSAYMP